MEESGVSEHSGGRQDIRERAGSHGRALTLVSFTKGGIPTTEVLTLHLLPQTLGFTKKCPIRNTAEWRCSASISSVYMERQREQNKKTDSQGESWQLDHMYASPSNFQRLNPQRVMRSVWTCHLGTPVSTVPQLPAQQCFLIHMYQLANMPPHQAMKT